MIERIILLACVGVAIIAASSQVAAAANYLCAAFVHFVQATLQ